MATITITPLGPFSLAASGAFLEGFAPARYPGHAPAGPTFSLDIDGSGFPQVAAADPLAELAARWTPYRSWLAFTISRPVSVIHLLHLVDQGGSLTQQTLVGSSICIRTRQPISVSGPSCSTAFPPARAERVAGARSPLVRPH